MTRRRFNTPEEETEALRNDPIFRALVEDLKRQTPAQIEGLEQWLIEEAEREERNGDRDRDETSEGSEA